MKLKNKLWIIINHAKNDDSNMLKEVNVNSG